MMKFIKSRTPRVSAERLRLQRELFAFEKVSLIRTVSYNNTLKAQFAKFFRDRLVEVNDSLQKRLTNSSFIDCATWIPSQTELSGF